MPNKNKTIKPLPPYGKKLFNALQCGYKPINDITLYVGKNAWEDAKYFSRFKDVLVLPQNNHPDKFNWCVVNGWSVLIFGADDINYQVIRKLVHSLLSYSASVVRVAFADDLIKFAQ